MKRNSVRILIVTGLLYCMALAGNAVAAIPLVVNHQGRISVGDAAFEGVGAFRFALVD
ncbi:MAG: hypothetical protein GXY07_07315, partial [Candidatus Hydrogenedentes bacterium]|nr:hypothetical protein [Candidatus Hydrogenedentota bacterium]